MSWSFGFSFKPSGNVSWFKILCSFVVHGGELYCVILRINLIKLELKKNVYFCWFVNWYMAKLVVPYIPTSYQAFNL